jgi:ATP-dependent helicase/nuclease subunit A
LSVDSPTGRSEAFGSQGSLFDYPAEVTDHDTVETAVSEPGTRVLTAEQENAAARRVGPLLIGAGAGSGKTSVLVERFVRAVREDGIAPGRILAITFTERAASELRQRIRDRFVELGERTAARELENAFLSTFHGFCVRLLRAHPLIAGIDPEFTILEEGFASHMRADAFARSLESFITEGGDPALELLAAYGADRTQAMILSVYAELRSRGEREPRLARVVIEGSTDMQRVALQNAILEASGELQMAYAKRPTRRLQSALDALELAGVLLEEEREDPEHPRSRARLAALELPAGASGVLAGPACESYRLALGEYRRARSDHAAAEACELLDDLLRRFDRSYEEIKRGRRTLDFDDLELLARDLLSSHEQLRSDWSERFDLLMVDEFQDSNPRQLQILGALERGNLCTVGDEFQSIYGFRHADVSLFRARRAELADVDAVLTLARNFRGRGELLEVTNAVFTAHFGADYTPLTAGREEAADRDSEGPLVELLLTDKPGWRKDGESPDAASKASAGQVSVAPWRVAEARMLAGRIAELIDAGQARAGEVVVLLRALGDVGIYERELEHRGLQTIAAVGGFWDHQQVSDLLAYLQALANPLDEQALYGTLASPLAGLSSDGLALVARAARGSGLGVWATIKDPQAEIHSRLAEADREALRAFAELFRQERSRAHGREIADILRRAIDASGYEEHVLGLRGRARRLANIHKLMRISRTFESGQGRDLRAFLEYVAHIRGLRENTEPDAPVADDSLDAVRLMSIHAAKGLEFPVVCIADLGRAGNVRMPDLLVDARGEDAARIGLQLVSLDGSASEGALDFEALRQKRLREEAAEERRIIYVAMTRARERLLLSGAADFGNWPDERPGSPPIGWVAPALIEGLPDHLRSLEEVSVRSLAAAGGAPVRCWLNIPAAAAGGEASSQAALPASDVSQAVHVTPRLRQKVPLIPVNRTPASRDVLAGERTLSYSSLTQLERCGYGYYLRHVLRLPDDHTAPQAANPRGGVQGRSRGLIVHRLLESVDFGRFAQPTAEDVLRAARECAIKLADGEERELAQFVGGLAGGELFSRLASAVSVAREQPFAFPVGEGEQLFTGVADLIARERDGGWLVVDYKTDQLAREEDLEALVRRDYDLQRLLYGLAALRGGASHVSVVHWFLERPEELVVARFSATQSEALKAQLIERVQHMRAGGFTVSDAPHRELCQTCPGRRGLCSWGPEMTLRELQPTAGQSSSVPGEDR